MRKKAIVSFFFIFLMVFCQTVFAAGMDGGWFPDEFRTYYDVEKEMIVETDTYEINVKHKPFLKGTCVMVPLKEMITIGARTKETTVILKEGDKDILPIVQILENPYDGPTLQKDDTRKTATIFWKGNTLVFFEGERNVYINGETRYLYTEPYIVEDEVYISAKDAPTLFCIVGASYQEGATYAAWLYDGGEKGERIDIKNYDFVEQTYQLSQSKLLQRASIEKKEVVQENELSGYHKENELMVEVGLLSYVLADFRHEFDACYEVYWDTIEKTAYIKTWNTLKRDIVIKGGSDIITVDEKEIKMSAPAEIKNDKLHIPFSAWSSILELPQERVQYDEGKTEVTFLYKTVLY